MKKTQSITAILSIPVALMLFVSTPSIAEAAKKSSGTCSASAATRLVAVGPSYSGKSSHKALQTFKKGQRWLKKLKLDFKNFGCVKMREIRPTVRNGRKESRHVAGTYIRVRVMKTHGTPEKCRTTSPRYITLKGKKYCKAMSGGAATYYK